MRQWIKLYLIGENRKGVRLVLLLYPRGTLSDYNKPVNHTLGVGFKAPEISLCDGEIR